MDTDARPWLGKCREIQAINSLWITFFANTTLWCPARAAILADSTAPALQPTQNPLPRLLQIEDEDDESRWMRSREARDG